MEINSINKDEMPFTKQIWNFVFGLMQTNKNVIHYISMKNSFIDRLINNLYASIVM